MKCQYYSTFVPASFPYQVPNRTSNDITWMIFYDNDVQQIFGFSNQSADFFLAREICRSYGAEFSLATLDTNFYVVTNYIAENYMTGDEFWVDVTKQHGCK